MSKFKIMDGQVVMTELGGYIDFYKDNLIVLSSRGLLAYTDDLEKKYLKQISNNLIIIEIEQYKKVLHFIQDLYIKIIKFMSHTNEQKKIAEYDGIEGSQKI